MPFRPFLPPLWHAVLGVFSVCLLFHCRILNHQKAQPSHIILLICAGLTILYPIITDFFRYPSPSSPWPRTVSNLTSLLFYILFSNQIGLNNLGWGPQVFPTSCFLTHLLFASLLGCLQDNLRIPITSNSQLHRGTLKVQLKCRILSEGLLPLFLSLSLRQIITVTFIGVPSLVYK